MPYARFDIGCLLRAVHHGSRLRSRTVSDSRLTVSDVHRDSSRTVSDVHHNSSRTVSDVQFPIVFPAVSYRSSFSQSELRHH